MSASEDDFSEEDEDYVPEDVESDDEEDNENSKETLVHTVDENGDSNKDKEKIDKLWESFKNEVSAEKKKDPKLIDEKQNEHKKNSNQEVEESNCVMTNKTENKSSDDTVLITQVYDFAGEDVKVIKEVKRDSEEAKKHFKQQNSAAPSKGGILGRSAISHALKKRPGGGIGSVLGKLGKKPKLSTLEKSKLDWKQYKEEEGIEEELQAYNKGKEGYLEKMSFLKRTEMRQFEKERDMRLNQSSKR